MLQKMALVPCTSLSPPNLTAYSYRGERERSWWREPSTNSPYQRHRGGKREACLPRSPTRERGRKGGKQGGERKGEAGRGEKGGVKEWGAHTRGRSGYTSLHMYWSRLGISTILKDKGRFKDCTWNFVPLWTLKDGHLFFWVNAKRFLSPVTLKRTSSL